MPLPVKAAAAEALPPSSAGDGGGLFVFPRIFSKVIAFCRGVCYTFVLLNKNAVSCGKAGSYPLPPA